ncbi:MAG: ABC transporter permease [Spirochaetales bacterium]|nr:ABC transporter permease [Spirochaetales bacterium]
MSIRPRTESSGRLQFFVLILSLFAGLVAVGILFLASGVDPFYAIGKIFSGSFGSFYGFKETITKAIPLILIGTGLTLAFNGKFWNIGAEGQLLMGAAFGTWVALTLGPILPKPVVIPLMFLAGFLGGAILGFIPAWFKVSFGINEVISTLMLNYIAFEIVQFLIVGPWKGVTQHGYPYTDEFPPSAQLDYFPGSRIHMFTLILALLIVVAMYLMVYRTKFGYEIRVIGENPEAGRYAGINFFKTLILVMVLSGGLAGIAGVGEVAGIHHRLSYPGNISAGYGFTAIIVAWLAKLNPLMTIFSGLFFAGILVGGDAIQISLNLPAATVEVFNGILLFFLIMGDFFTRNRIVFHRKGE